MVKLGSVYLALYNVSQALGWSVVFWYYINLKNYQSYESEFYLKVFQTLALLEVLHACFGLVKSSPLTTAIQISSRIFVVWGVMHLYPAAKRNLFFAKMMVMSWCFAEITRYWYYFCCLVYTSPKFLTYLRYSLFMVLYPTGIIGELALIWFSLPYVKVKSPFDLRLPNVLNFALDGYTIYWVVLLSYIPLSPIMYKHMLAQRKRILAASVKKLN